MRFKIKKNTGERTILGFLLIISLFVFSSIIPMFKINILTKIFPYAYAMFLCWYLIKYLLTEYTYTFGEELFTIEKETSYKITTYLKVSFEDILFVKNKKMYAKNLTVGFLDKNYLVIAYKEDGKERYAKIHKNDQLILSFKEKIGDRFYE